MKTTLSGHVDRPAVAIVGVWDPFLPVHEELCATLAASAHERSRASLAIMLHPNPPALISGDHTFPMYDDVPARVWRLRASGIDAVLKLQMTRADVDGGAATFLDAVLGAVPLAELWLGHSQSLGRGETGSRDTVVALAAQRGVQARVLPRAPQSAGAGFQALRLLVDGRLTEAIGCVGHPPIRRRPRSGVLRLPWRPGRYTAVPLDHPGASPCGPEVAVTLGSSAQCPPTLRWPDRQARYLAFIAGSADEARAS